MNTSSFLRGTVVTLTTGLALLLSQQKDLKCWEVIIAAVVIYALNICAFIDLPREKK